MSLIGKLLALFFRLPQPLRYLFVGGWNTLFGFSIYALLFHLFSGVLHYMLLLIPANILAITNAFFCYKYLVFRSRGKGWMEYLRCCCVYGGVALFNAGLLYLLVTLYRVNPVVANGISIVFSIMTSYFSHKYFSFPRGRGRI